MSLLPITSLDIACYCVQEPCLSCNVIFKDSFCRKISILHIRLCWVHGNMIKVPHTANGSVLSALQFDCAMWRCLIVLMMTMLSFLKRATSLLMVQDLFQGVQWHMFSYIVSKFDDVKRDLVRQIGFEGILATLNHKSWSQVYSLVAH